MPPDYRFEVPFQDRKFSVPFDKEPSPCPRCHHAVTPNLRTTVLTGGDPGHPNTKIQAVYRCPNRACEGLFIASYRFGNFGVYELRKVEPHVFAQPVLSDEIAKVSPRFVKIYGQAAEADASGHDEISGPGYRKALEFLVKDFLVSQDKDSEGDIRRELLGTCIKNRVDDPRLKAMAERAAWLGNDQTHYEKLFEEYDVAALRGLIQLAMHWIGASLLTDHRTATITPRRR
jgi:hypothetical protein